MYERQVVEPESSRLEKIVGGFGNSFKWLVKFETGYDLVKDIVKVVKDRNLDFSEKFSKSGCYFIGEFGKVFLVNSVEYLGISGSISEGEYWKILPVVGICEGAKLVITYGSRLIANLEFKILEDSEK